MARYKPYDYTQAKLLPIAFSRQILPGTFEYTLHYIVEHDLDLSIFESRCKNDGTGAPAYDPAILLKIIVYAYARGITSSREIEQCCRENAIFMALSADTQPHFTIIASFMSTMADEIMPLLLEVLMICDEMRMIGKEMSVIDGCKLPSNAAREHSGTRAELDRKVRQMQGAIDYLLKKHRQEDEQGTPSEYRQKEVRQQQALAAQVKKIKNWLNDHDPRFAGRDRYKERHRQEVRQSQRNIYHPAAFLYGQASRSCIFPAGTPEGRQQYSRRLGIVEPVFGHIASVLGLKRFSSRCKVKVDIQWKLYCIVHNLLKIHR